MRKPIVAGNWKMNGSQQQVKALLTGIESGFKESGAVELIIFPPYVYLAQTEKALTGSAVKWGAQNVSAESAGAFTGEVSATMLQDFNCTYVLVGHSERRQLYGEDDAIVAAKFFAAIQAGLVPILCVGETLDERNNKATFAVIGRQIDVVLTLEGGVEALKQAVVAYEPVWAIGTGLSATPEQAQEVHQFIRGRVEKYQKTVAKSLRILYGGSVKSSNAQALFTMPDIDGGLIGGASLDAKEFLEIANHAAARINFTCASSN